MKQLLCLQLLKLLMEGFQGQACPDKSLLVLGGAVGVGTMVLQVINYVIFWP